jgi:hypothetical protein
VKWWLTALQLLKDVVATGLGAWLLIRQGLSADPNGGLELTALSLLAPAAISHAATLLLSGPSGPGHGPSGSSPSSPPSSPLPSSRQGGTPDGAA